jgi:tetratricopeptide (TPR) repeat protein
LSDIHITPELMEAVERGDLHPDVLRELEWSHLMHLCPTCRAGARAWLERAQSRSTENGAALQILPFVLAHHAVDEEKKASQAERDLRDLLPLPQAERLAKIDRARRRFRGVLLAHRLLNEAKRHIPEQPQEMHDLAEAAEKVLLRSPYSPGYFDALTRATAYRANALRAGGKLREAAERMAYARSLVRHEHVTELLVYAEVDWLEGVLRKDEHRFQEAGGLLTRSAALFDLAGEKIEASRPLLALGLAYYDQQQLAKAIETTEAALAFLPPESEPRLYLCGRHNLTLFYIESGRYEAAAALLAEDEALYRQFPDWTTLRKLWLAGKIALRTGRLAEAEEAFLQVRSGFLDQGIGYDAAMVSLDLALVYLQQSRTPELKALAEEMHAVFASEDVHREAVAALLLFQEAARREAVTAELVEEISAYLRRARGNPGMRFQAP